ncbi:MAG: class I SAM-dependent methyltransferase [Candidatus Diapherotrites archaeon]|nr:class I SAM-dependent methyltransferase [Candidatus Diapherotrites archaeon]
MTYTPGRKTSVLARIILEKEFKRVLDVGCSKGYLGEETRAQNPGIEFAGIDVSKEALAEAKKSGYVQTIQKDLNEVPLAFPELKGPSFDCMVFADVLEHTLQPSEVLGALLPFLEKDGRVFVALPNVAFLPLRVKLLLGKWDYKKSGIMDESHARFYNLKSARALLEENGLHTVRMESFPKRIPSWIWPSLLAITFLFECERK